MQHPAARLARSRGFRLAALIAVVAAFVGVLLSGAATVASAKPTPPPLPSLGPKPTNPSNQQISSAQSAKQNLADQVGALGGQIAQAESELRSLQGEQEMAEQRVALAVSQLRDAQHAAALARAAVRSAARGVAAAHSRFVSYLQADYMDGDSQTSTGALLTARDPSALLDRTSLVRFQEQDKLDAIGQLQRATVVKSNADARARAAVLDLSRKAAAARQAKRRADAAVAAEQAQEAQLQQSLQASRAQLASAQLQLATLDHQRVQFLAYQARKARIARIEARRAERRQRIRARHLAALERAAERRAARERAARQRERESQGGNGGGGSTGGGGGGTGGAGTGGGGGGHQAPSTGHWTAAEAATAVRRAKSELGMPYAWAGGTAWGPTYGVCSPSNGAPYDCHVYGFDCSGLAMYAWGPYLSMPHYAASQYWVAGHFHPSASQLRPGDLVFWSYNGQASGIHHVAIYIGHGQIIEAPYSGGYVQIRSVWEYGSFFGATRPLS